MNDSVNPEFKMICTKDGKKWELITDITKAHDSIDQMFFDSSREPIDVLRELVDQKLGVFQDQATLVVKSSSYYKHFCHILDHPVTSTTDSSIVLALLSQFDGVYCSREVIEPMYEYDPTVFHTSDKIYFGENFSVTNYDIYESGSGKCLLLYSKGSQKRARNVRAAQGKTRTTRQKNQGIGLYSFLVNYCYQLRRIISDHLGVTLWHERNSTTREMITCFANYLRIARRLNIIKQTYGMTFSSLDDMRNGIEIDNLENWSIYLLSRTRSTIKSDYEITDEIVALYHEFGKWLRAEVRRYRRHIREEKDDSCTAAKND